MSELELPQVAVPRRRPDPASLRLDREAALERKLSADAQLRERIEALSKGA